MPVCREERSHFLLKNAIYVRVIESRVDTDVRKEEALNRKLNGQDLKGQLNGRDGIISSITILR